MAGAARALGVHAPVAHAPVAQASVAHACVALALAALVLAGCRDGEAPRGAGSPAARLLLVTQAPPGSAAADPAAARRWPAGSALLLVDLDRPDDAPRPLSAGMTAAGGGQASADGERVLFLGREGAEPMAIWACRIDGSERSVLVPGGERALGAAAWLPDGRVVYAAAVGEVAAAPAVERAWALFVAPGDGTDGARITFSAGCDLDPTVLGDGRVLFASWLPDAPGRPGGAMALMTVHPDGSGLALYHGAAVGPPVKRAPCQDDAGTVAYLGGERWEEGAALLTDRRAPLEAPRVLLGDLPPVRALAPLGAGAWVLAREGQAALQVVGPQRASERMSASLAGDPVAHLAPAGPRRRPQGHLSMIKPGPGTGQVLCVDAREGAGAAKRALSEGARVRVRALAGPFADGLPPPGRSLGEAPLATDGSFFVRVPADVPLLVEVLDQAGAVVDRSHAPFWVRPGEMRGCVGCHESRDTVPANVRPLAVMQGPIDLLGEGAEEGP